MDVRGGECGCVKGGCEGWCVRGGCVRMDV